METFISVSQVPAKLLPGQPSRHIRPHGPKILLCACEPLLSVRSSLYRDSGELSKSERGDGGAGRAGVPVALDPTPRRAAALASHCGAVRVAFNWGLAQVKANLAQREAERSYGLARRSAHPRVVMVDARTA
ncbi:hypothetical protein E1294_51400 [Nonomuraea diastatica]|uniref:Transposase putative helix-turn-helix domain-containing protein n=1 Tax=Nonomuraea diastatica TaxID=1848329 RepID=A0A4R4V9K8_9ACTN|nr:hypothetical protein E1294_51400 [Nonomuraea diastatica]